MDGTHTALERAFELAKSGEFTRVQDVILKVEREGYPRRQLEGFALRKQLTKLVRESKAVPPITAVPR
jgi:hypothetical protein